MHPSRKSFHDDVEQSAKWRTPPTKKNVYKGPVVITALLCAALFLLSFHGHESLSTFQKAPKLPMFVQKKGQNDGVAVNSTLGFERIFAINLNHRRDKHDEFTLMGYMSDVDVEMTKAVTTVELDSMVTTERAKTATAPEFAAIRSHINILTKIVKEKISTALIFEDDVDWEVEIKKSLRLFQTPLATLVSGIRQDGKVRKPTKHAPYAANDWDMIVLAACNEGHWDADLVRQSQDPALQRAVANDPSFLPFVTYQDSMVADDVKLRQEVKQTMLNSNVTVPTRLTPPYLRERMIVRARIPTCATGYAVTLRGAAKLLYHLTRPTFDPLDWEFAHMAQSGQLEAYTVVPSLMDQWILTGKGAFNSDIHANKVIMPQKARMDDGWTPNLQQSVRQSLRKIVQV